MKERSVIFCDNVGWILGWHPIHSSGPGASRWMNRRRSNRWCHDPCWWLLYGCCLNKGFKYQKGPAVCPKKRFWDDIGMDLPGGLDSNLLLLHLHRYPWRAFTWSRYQSGQGWRHRGSTVAAGEIYLWQASPVTWLKDLVASKSWQNIQGSMVEVVAMSQLNG